MNGKTNKSMNQDSKEIQRKKRQFYKAIADMKELDQLATEVSRWEDRFGHLAIGMPSVYEIVQLQRERLITAMWYNKTLKIRDAELDAYLQWKVEVLATL